MPDEYQAYGVTQHADADMTTANAMVGERISPVPANAVVGSPALFSTAPYIPPITNGRKTSRVGKCKGKNDTCNAYPISGSDLCVFHAPGQARHDREDEVSPEEEVDPEPPVAS